MTRPRQTYARHARSVLILGLPLVGSHLAQFSITLTDALMLGWYDVEALAAQVLAGGMFFVLFIMGSGFAWAVMPMAAKALGEGDAAQARRATRMGLWLSTMFAALALPPLWLAEPILLALGQPPGVAELAQVYLRIAGWAIVPALQVMVLKSFLSALERAQAVLWITLVAVAVNIVLNWLLIFGNAGFPELGIRGAAIASVAVQAVSILALAAYVLVRAPEHAIFRRLWRPDREAFGRVFRLGWPISLTSLAEVGLFKASAIMMGWLGTLPLAAHGIALQITATSFMVHVGLSNAATVRAGRALGRRDPSGLRQGAAVALAMSGIMAATTMAIFLAFPESLIGLFLDPDDPDRAAVLGIGVGLLAAAALFQLADAAQVMALGLLRGIQDTRVPMLMAAASYWGLGIAASYTLGFVWGWGGVGIWLGLATGLAAAGAMMTARFWMRARRM